MFGADRDAVEVLYRVSAGYDKAANGRIMRRTHPFHRTGGLPAALLCCIAPFSSVVADPGTTTFTGEQTVTVIKTPPEILTRQKLPNIVGISAEAARTSRINR